MMQKFFLSLIVSLSIATTYSMDSTTVARQQWGGEEYDKISEPQFRAAMEIIEPLDLTNEDILEIGCGSGRLSQVLSQKASQGTLHAIDASESMVAKARERCGNLPNRSFEVIDAQKLAYHNCFTRVLSFAALHWMPDQAAVLKGCHNALKSGEKLLVSVRAKDPEFALIKAYRLTAQEEEWAMLRTINPSSQDYPLDKETFMTLLHESGFQKIDVTEGNVGNSFTPEELKDFLNGVLGGCGSFSTLKKENPERMKALITALVRNYAKVEEPDVEGKLAYRPKVLIAEALK